MWRSTEAAATMRFEWNIDGVQRNDTKETKSAWGGNFGDWCHLFKVKEVSADPSESGRVPALAPLSSRDDVRRFSSSQFYNNFDASRQAPSHPNGFHRTKIIDNHCSIPSHLQTLFDHCCWYLPQSRFSEKRWEERLMQNRIWVVYRRYWSIRFESRFLDLEATMTKSGHVWYNTTFKASSQR